MSHQQQNAPTGVLMRTNSDHINPVQASLHLPPVDFKIHAPLLKHSVVWPLHHL